VLASALWIVGCAAIFAFHLYAQPVCYAIFTASFVDPVPEKDRALVQDIQQNLVNKPICGDAQPSLLLSAERLAKEGVLKQISFQWHESAGWSSDYRAWIEILEGDGIQIAAIQHTVRDYVRLDRLRADVWLAYVAVGAPIIAFLIGVGMFWIIAGFQPSRKSA
jgi:hypothetical protein